MKYHVVPYVIFGVKLYAVEDSISFISKYCDTKERAQEICKALNKGNHNE